MTEIIPAPPSDAVLVLEVRICVEKLNQMLRDCAMRKIEVELEEIEIRLVGDGGRNHQYTARIRKVL